MEAGLNLSWLRSLLKERPFGNYLAVPNSMVLSTRWDYTLSNDHWRRLELRPLRVQAPFWFSGLGHNNVHAIWICHTLRVQSTQIWGIRGSMLEIVIVMLGMYSVFGGTWTLGDSVFRIVASTQGWLIMSTSGWFVYFRMAHPLKDGLHPRSPDHCAGQDQGKRHGRWTVCDCRGEPDNKRARAFDAVLACWLAPEALVKGFG